MPKYRRQILSRRRRKRVPVQRREEIRKMLSEDGFDVRLCSRSLSRIQNLQDGHDQKRTGIHSPPS